MFIVFEGIDGTGKGTTIDLVSSYLKKKLGAGMVVNSKDPGGTPLGLAVRRLIYEDVPMNQMAPGVIDLLFLASHIQNWQTVVKPALDAGRCVISDRWWYSQEAYMTQRVVPEPVAKAYADCHGDRADLLIFLHGDPQKMVDRARARESETHQSAKTWNDAKMLETIQGEYFKKFSKLEEFCPICVDDLSPEEVYQKVKTQVDKLLRGEERFA